ncbi:MAG: hypothetical protein HYX44_16650, partial [Aquabacterium sp.]|nr:hypothetical protein [Aquabacterium sp.]
MNKPLWLPSLSNVLLGVEPHQRRHVLLILLTLQPYAVSVGVIMHSVHLGLLDLRAAQQLTVASVLTFLTFFALIRSGWSQRFG